jgi:hypothetical protein
MYRRGIISTYAIVFAMQSVSGFKEQAPQNDAGPACGADNRDALPISSVRQVIAGVCVIRVAACVVIEAVTEDTAVSEMLMATEAAARLGKMRAHRAASESAASAAEMAAAEAAAHASAAEAAAHMSATEATAHMPATEATAHMPATAETSTVPTPTSAAARKRVSSQSPGESGSRRQDDHGFPQHWILLSTQPASSRFEPKA